MNSHRRTSALRLAVRSTLLAGGLFLLAGLVVAAPAQTAQAMDSIQNAYDLYKYRLNADLAKLDYYYTSSDAAGDPRSTQSASTRAQAVSQHQAAEVYNEPGKVPATKVADAKAAAKKAWKLPATGAKPLVKGVAGAATVVTGYSLGTMIGNGVVSFFGVDATGAVCSQGDAADFLAIATGVDCTDYGFVPGFVPNSDVSGGMSSGWSCQVANPEKCMRITRISGTLPPFGPFPARHVIVIEAKGFNEARPGISIRSRTTSGSESTASLQAYLQPGNGPFECGGTGQQSGYCNSFVDATEQIVSFSIDGSGGTPAPVTASPADPERTISCEILGTDGKLYSASTPGFKESSGTLPPPVCPSLPDGVVPENVKVKEQGAGDPKTLYDESTNSGTKDHLQRFPECSDGSCVLDLRDSKGQSCFRAGAACLGWYEAPDRATKYSCTYGTHNVPLEDCTVYRDVFDPQKRAAGQAYVDPVTGERVQGEVKTSDPAKATDGSTRPVTDADVRGNCWGAGWGDANPLNWVMQPVQCALEWAFVPRPSVLDREVAKMKTTWDGSGPGLVAATVTSWDIQPTVTGCYGIPIDIPLPPDGTHRWKFSILDACTGPLVPVAALSRTVLTITFFLWAALAMTRYVGRTIGFTGIGGGGGDS